MKSRLFFKIFVTYLIITICSISIVILLVSHEIKVSSMARIEEELFTYARIIDLSSKKEIREKIKQLAGISGSRVTIVDMTGKIIADSEHEIADMESHLNRPEIQEARVKGKGSAMRFSQTIGVDMLYVALPFMDGSEINGYVRLARPLHDVKRSIESIYRSFFTAIFLAIPFTLIIAFIFSYRLTSPIKAMEQFTERLRKGEIAGSLLIKTTDEMQQLANNINYLVTELQEKIRLADEEKGKLVAAFASMMEGVLILDHDDRIEVFNRAFRDMIMPLYGDVLGKTLIEAFRNIDLQRALDIFKKTGQSISQEITFGDIIPIILNVSISTIQGSPGENKTMIVFYDVTRLKKLEKVRVDFVANVTHEIKTPLTSILGFIETLQDGAIEDVEKAGKFLEIIDRQARRLNRLVEDLLTISDIEMGDMKFFFEDVPLISVIENILPIIEAKANEKEIKIMREMPDSLPSIKADQDRLAQILWNVLDNAVKFTPISGMITISASVENNRYVAVRIADTGIGIPRDEIPRLGERFYRVDKARSRELGGTGLGLSIVKHLMKAHQGYLEIESQPGEGTTVSLYFPIYQVSSA
jgi:two-component system phosphate regulon sensor histidine kinase PhoR